jgi:hypothetical protein
MPDRVHTAVQPMQVPRLDSVANAVFVEPRVPKLLDGQDAVLSSSNRSNPLICRGAKVAHIAT